MSKTKLKWLSRIMTSLGLLSSIYSFFILGTIMAKVERTITDETWLLVALGIFIFYFFSIYFILLLHELGHAFLENSLATKWSLWELAIGTLSARRLVGNLRRKR